MTAARPITPAALARYVAAVREATGREVVAVRVLGDGGVELTTATDNAANPADLVRMDD